MILLWVLLKAQPPQQILLPSFQQLVEDVEVPLTVVLVHNSGFLQEVVQDVASNRSPLKQTRHMEMSISTEENVSASWESVQRQDLKQKPTKAQKMICHCVPQTPAWGGFEWAKIPSRNSPKLSVEGLKETWRPGGWQCWAPQLLHCAHLAGVGQLGSQGTQTLCRVTQDRDYLQISLFMWIYLGSIHWHRALEIKYPRNKRVWSQGPLREK